MPKLNRLLLKDEPSQRRRKQTLEEQAEVMNKWVKAMERVEAARKGKVAG
jgi:hypothetical protein